jgi:biopolymer transport protein ExbD
MGAKLGGGEGDEDDLGLNHDINVTPFIDVILVLLIIFMVAAPLATVDVPVDLPTSTAPPQPRPDKPLFVSVKSDLSLSLGEEAFAQDALGAALDRQTGGDRSQRVFLRADKAVSYGDLMGVMNTLRAAGYLKIALVGLEDGARR